MKRLIIALFFICSVAYASDYHQSGSTHLATYVILDTNGNAVSGQAVGICVKRVSDGAYLDFYDNTFKTSGWNNRIVNMNYDSTDSFYNYTITVDSAVIVSGDYSVIISNDSGTYKDRQVDVVNFDNISKLIKTQR